MIITTRKLLLALPVACLLFPSNVTATPFLPAFFSSNFTTGQPVNNTYFPIINNTTRIYQAEGVNEEGESFTERFELSGLGLGPTILGVQTTIQRDRAYENNLLVEDTFDYYAQDMDGNVWYMGEDVTNYVYDDDDNLISTNSSSSWRAGVNDASPGWIMPVDLTIDFNYYQEFAELDGALDEATTNMTGISLSLAMGDFDNVLRVLETNPSGDLEFKYYAPGIGLVKAEEGLSDLLNNPELTFEYSGTQPVPEPATMLLLGAGLATFAGITRRRGKSKLMIS